MDAHLVSIRVGRSDLDGSGQVEDDGVLLGPVETLIPGLHNGIADLDGKLRLSLGKCLGAVLELPVGLVAAGFSLVDELSDELGVLDGELDGLLFRVSEHGFAEQRGCGVVEMEDDSGGIADRLKRAADEVFSGLREDLDSSTREQLSVNEKVNKPKTHLKPNTLFVTELLVDDASDKVEVGLRGTGEGDFDLFEAAGDELRTKTGELQSLERN